MFEVLLLLGATALAKPPVPTPPIQAEAAAPDDADGAGITYSDADDPRMGAARARARAELPAFFERLRSPAADEGTFVVKFDLGGSGEFIWATNLVRNGGRLTGELANTPLHADYRVGQRVDIPDEAIADWGFFRGTVMQGNYTTRVQLEVMDPQDARALRRTLGW